MFIHVCHTAVPMSSWNDSDAEQQTLHELRATLKKEKTREMQNEAARKQLQGSCVFASMFTCSAGGTVVLVCRAPP